MHQTTWMNPKVIMVSKGAHCTVRSVLVYLHKTLGNAKTNL